MAGPEVHNMILLPFPDIAFLDSLTSVQNFVDYLYEKLSQPVMHITIQKCNGHVMVSIL